MIQTFKCDGNCSSEQCRAMGGGWYVYGSNGKQGFFRFETAKMGPFASQQEAQTAGERTWPGFIESCESTSHTIIIEPDRPTWAEIQADSEEHSYYDRRRVLEKRAAS